MITKQKQIIWPYSKFFETAQLTVFSQNICALSIKTSRSSSDNPGQNVHTILFELNQENQDQETNQSIISQDHKFSIFQKTKILDLEKDNCPQFKNNKKQIQSENFQQNLNTIKYLFTTKNQSLVRSQSNNDIKRQCHFDQNFSRIKAVSLYNKEGYLSIQNFGLQLVLNKCQNKCQNKCNFKNAYKKQILSSLSVHHVFNFKSIHNLDDRHIISQINHKRHLDEQDQSRCQKMILMDLQYQQVINQWGYFSKRQSNQQTFTQNVKVLSTNTFCAGVFDLQNNIQMLKLYDIRIKGSVQVISTNIDPQLSEIVFQQLGQRFNFCYLDYNNMINLNPFNPLNLLTFINVQFRTYSLPILIDLRKPGHYQAVKYAYKFGDIRDSYLKPNYQNQQLNKLWTVERDFPNKSFKISKHNISF